MNIQFYVEKLSHSKEFKDFMKKNPNAYLCSVFFIVDRVGKDNKQHIDYYLPNEKKISSFQMESNFKETTSELINDQIPEKISQHEFEFEEIENMIQEEMENKNMKNKIEKIIFSLHNFNKKDELTCTVFISMLGILKVSVDLSDKKITEFEKKSLFDMIKNS